MALPKSKQSLADYMLRRCGAPVVNVEVSDVQLEDCIDDAVKMYQEYHYDGNERTYRVLEVNAKVIAENQRRHQDITAPVFNHDSEYKILYKQLECVSGTIIEPSLIISTSINLP